MSAIAVRVHARLFAIQRELAGTREVALELAPNATVEDGWAALVERYPMLAPGRPSVRFARNGEYVDAGEPLGDGDELAVIPPVSGGAGTSSDSQEHGKPGPRRRILELREEAFGPGIIAELADGLATAGDGAIVGFLGRTRETPGSPAPGQKAEAASHADGSVESLEYEAHDSMARRTLEDIAQEVDERFGVRRLAIVHRTGDVPLGEVSVAVVAVAPHRDAAFAAARYAIDETKARAPIWKAERFADGHVWVGEPARSGPRDGEPAGVRVYISVDMEGIAGVSHPKPTERADSGYSDAVRLMVGEANAAVEGALSGGATEILVNDSHGGMYNLTPADIHPDARLLQGQKAWSMIAGAEPRNGRSAEDGSAFDLALFVGYHARAGHPTGTIAHTFSGRLVETRLNGRPTGEYGLNAAALGHWGIPVGLVAGDDALTAEVAEWLPWAERVVVKEGHGGNAASSLHPDRARRLIQEAAERAVRRAAAGELQPLRVDSPVTIEVEYRRGVEADFAAVVPGAERFGDRGVRFVAPDAVTAYRGFLAGVRLAGTVD